MTTLLCTCVMSLHFTYVYADLLTCIIYLCYTFDDLYVTYLVTILYYTNKHTHALYNYNMILYNYNMILRKNISQSNFACLMICVAHLVIMCN